MTLSNFERRNMRLAIVAAVSVSVLSVSGAAVAYVGPGAGITMIGALWAVVVAVLFMIGGLLIWPIRAALKRGKKQSAARQADETTGTRAEAAAAVLASEQPVDAEAQSRTGND